MIYDNVDVEDLVVEQHQVVQAQRRFDDAELSDDRLVLEELLHEEFLSIGPKGFLLDKRQWIDRHEHFAYHEPSMDARSSPKPTPWLRPSKLG